MVALSPVADPDLHIRRGGCLLDPEISGRGGGGLKKLFRPFGTQFDPKIRGALGLRGPSPGSATAYYA